MQLKAGLLDHQQLNMLNDINKFCPQMYKKQTKALIEQAVENRKRNAWSSLEESVDDELY